ncbi:MAG TPA: DUF72 domain-containing protein [Streptosporangiaceae bacterium]|jgi:uncharacterized protein YecE (DUF72 family)
MPVLVGTSGWQYRDWRGVLYPDGVPQRRWLEHYASQYATVENNNSFYRLPSRDTFATWRDRTPDGFVMAVKASRYLTHIRRLRDPAEPVARLLGAAAGLGPRLGPVLLQLPPNLAADPPLLAACLDQFRTAARAAGTGPVRVAVELRHPSWWAEDQASEVRQVLADHDAALCWADRLGHPVSPLWRTAGWGYLRFHEGAAQPWPRYGPQALRSWAERIQQTWPGAADVYVYFNNDPGGAAVRDSAAFAALARQAGLTVTRTPRASG